MWWVQWVRNAHKSLVTLVCDAFLRRQGGSWPHWRLLIDKWIFRQLQWRFFAVGLEDRTEILFQIGTFFCGIKKQLQALLGISLTSLVTTNKLNSVQLCDKAPLKAVSATIFAASASSWLEDFSLTGLAVENLLKSETRIYIRNSFLGRIQIANMCMLITVVMPILFREVNNISYTRISLRKNNVLCNCNFWLRERTCCRILGITPCEIYLVRSWIIILRIHGLNLPLLPTADHGNYLARGGNKRKYFHWFFPIWFQEKSQYALLRSRLINSSRLGKFIHGKNRKSLLFMEINAFVKRRWFPSSNQELK